MGKNIHSSVQFFYKVIKKKKMGIGVKCKPQIHSKTNILTPTPKATERAYKTNTSTPPIILLFISFIRPNYVVT
jgi:hypothetical protein